eukprot:3412504-Pyramimonas_sp.AAC.1
MKTVKQIAGPILLAFRSSTSCKAGKGQILELRLKDVFENMTDGIAFLAPIVDRIAHGEIDDNKNARYAALRQAMKNQGITTTKEMKTAPKPTQAKKGGSA